MKRQLDDSSSCSCINVMKFLRLLRFLVYGYFCCSFFHLGLVHGFEEDSSSHILTRSPRDSSNSSSSSNNNNSNYSHGLFKLEITHRFSDKARIELKEKRYHGVGDHVHHGSSWPILGSAEYHNMLWNRDWRRHRGRLLMSPSKHSLLTYSAGNLTEEWTDG